MKNYLDLMRHVRDHGVSREDRTGVGTLSVFGGQLRFDLSKGFPLVTTKYIHTHAVIHELLWMLAGETNIQPLKNAGVHIWDAWADKYGDLGPIYGHQWRDWRISCKKGFVDQIDEVVHSIRNDPYSRRHIVSAWNVEDIPQMALPPCHVLFQFYVAEGKLSCHLYQRSADIFIGLPFNIASYALLTMMMAQVTRFVPGDLIISLGDAHLYRNHLEQVETQLSHAPYPLPTMRLDPTIEDIFYFDPEHFELENYQHHPAIKAPVAV